MPVLACHPVLFHNAPPRVGYFPDTPLPLECRAFVTP
jgi:hypothetical protein